MLTRRLVVPLVIIGFVGSDSIFPVPFPININSNPHRFYDYTGPPTYASTGPPIDYMAPISDYNPPRSDYNPPRSDYNPPRSDYNPPRSDYNPPRSDYNPPRSDYNPPRSDYNPPRSDYNPPKSDYSSSNTFQSSPIFRLGLTIRDSNRGSKGYSDGGGYKGSIDGYNSPVVDYKGSSNVYNPPVKDYNPHNDYKTIGYDYTPPVIDYNPLNDHISSHNDYTPVSNNYNPPSSNYNTRSRNHHNPTSNNNYNVPVYTYQQSNIHLSNPSNSYKVPEGGYDAPQKGHSFSTVLHHPPKSDYRAPATIYTTTSNDYRNSGSHFTTPSSLYESVGHGGSSLAYSFPTSHGHGGGPTGYSSTTVSYGKPVQLTKADVSPLRITTDYRSPKKSTEKVLLYSAPPGRPQAYKRRTTELRPTVPTATVRYSSSSSSNGGFHPILKPSTEINAYKSSSINHWRPIVPTTSHPKTVPHKSYNTPFKPINTTVRPTTILYTTTATKRPVSYSTTPRPTTTTVGYIPTTEKSYRPLHQFIQAQLAYDQLIPVVPSPPRHLPSYNQLPTTHAAPHHDPPVIKQPQHGIHVSHKGSPKVTTVDPIHSTPAPQIGQIHGNYGSSQYHYSWIAKPGSVFTWSEADLYCSSLGHDWQLVSLEKPEENAYISQVIAKENIKYVWIGGFREPGSKYFVWLSGGTFNSYNWSNTGGRDEPQPDNREGNEYYMALLNNIFKDGVKWHDIANQHTKPCVCERNTNLESYV